MTTTLTFVVPSFSSSSKADRSGPDQSNHTTEDPVFLDETGNHIARNLCLYLKRMIEVEPPSPLRYMLGAVIIMIGVVLPVGYTMLRNKRDPSSSSYSKGTKF
ncbi:uncharacterized protein LOC120113431 [Hibiscus syriacus]|uniref:uncharacterized protein LOC120113431 n=1 Tax=Hibiscus syriacus TaxID=106335 RepID=UPI001922A0BE|nr:uncharacterized protein LOC120113431 [Hibiscus syriacus]